MDELEKAIEDTKTAYDEWEYLKNCGEDWSSVHRSLKVALDALQTVKQNRWIPVTERLPKETGLYLISIKTKGVEGLEEIYPDGLVYVSAYDAVIMHWGYGGENVQAWMELPASYQEADHE